MAFFWQLPCTAGAGTPAADSRPPPPDAAGIGTVSIIGSSPRTHKNTETKKGGSDDGCLRVSVPLQAAQSPDLVQDLAYTARRSTPQARSTEDNVDGLALPGRWRSVAASRYLVGQPLEGFSSATHQRNTPSDLLPAGPLVQSAKAVERTSQGRQSIWWDIYGKDYTNERTRLRPIRREPWSEEVRKDPRRTASAGSDKESGGIRLCNAFSTLCGDDQLSDVNEPPIITTSATNWDDLPMLVGPDWGESTSPDEPIPNPKARGPKKLRK